MCGDDGLVLRRKLQILLVLALGTAITRATDAFHPALYNVSNAFPDELLAFAFLLRAAQALENIRKLSRLSSE